MHSIYEKLLSATGVASKHGANAASDGKTAEFISSCCGYPGVSNLCYLFGCNTDLDADTFDSAY